VVARLLGVVLVGVLAAACGSGGTSANAPSGVASGRGSTTTTVPTTGTPSTTLPSCGATRDPLDPTNTGPPAGSPATC